MIVIMTIPVFGISGTTDSAFSLQRQPLTSGFLSWSLWDWSRTTLESTQSELTRTPPHSTDSTSWACWRLLGHLFSWYYRTFPSSFICTSGAQWLCGTLWPGTWCLLIYQSYQVLSLAHFYYFTRELPGDALVISSFTNIFSMQPVFPPKCIPSQH